MRVWCFICLCVLAYAMPPPVCELSDSDHSDAQNLSDSSADEAPPKKRSKPEKLGSNKLADVDVLKRLLSVPCRCARSKKGPRTSCFRFFVNEGWTAFRAMLTTLAKDVESPILQKLSLPSRSKIRVYTFIDTNPELRPGELAGICHNGDKIA